MGHTWIHWLPRKSVKSQARSNKSQPQPMLLPVEGNNFSVEGNIFSYSSNWIRNKPFICSFILLEKKTVKANNGGRVVVVGGTPNHITGKWHAKQRTEERASIPKCRAERDINRQSSLWFIEMKKEQEIYGLAKAHTAAKCGPDSEYWTARKETNLTINPTWPRQVTSLRSTPRLINSL